MHSEATSGPKTHLCGLHRPAAAMSRRSGRSVQRSQAMMRALRSEPRAWQAAARSDTRQMRRLPKVQQRQQTRCRSMCRRKFGAADISS